MLWHIPSVFCFCTIPCHGRDINRTPRSSCCDWSFCFRKGREREGRITIACSMYCFDRFASIVVSSEFKLVFQCLIFSTRIRISTGVGFGSIWAHYTLVRSIWTYYTHLSSFKSCMCAWKLCFCCCPDDVAVTMTCFVFVLISGSSLYFRSCSEDV